MAYVDKSLVDQRIIGRLYAQHAEPNLVRWSELLAASPRGVDVYGGFAGLACLFAIWGINYGMGSFGWGFYRLTFTLPPKPVGCYGMAWLTTFYTWNYDREILGRALFDLDSWQTPIGKFGTRMTPSPLWKTWNYKRQVVVDPQAQARVPLVLPTGAARIIGYSLLTLKVRYYY